jgi:hypothetical protein
MISASSLASLALIGGLLAAESALPHRAPSPRRHATFPQEQVHGVLSRAQLSPPLRGPARQIRFSANGKFLLVQVESGIYILSRDPLEMRAWIYAREILPARFSADSRTLVLATRNLEITWWSLADNRKIDEKILKTRDGCLVSELSASGELAACLDPALMLEVYRTDTGEQILAERDVMPYRLTSVGIIPRNEGTAYAEPFGFGVSDNLDPLANRDLFRSQFLFSPEGHFLLLIDPQRSAVCVDVLTRRKIGCPAIVKARPSAPICFVSPSELAVLDEREPDKSEIITFPGGQLVTKLHFAARSALSATQPKYLVFRANDGEDQVRLFDRNAAREVTARKETQMDVWADTLATYAREGELKLARLGEEQQEAKTVLPPPVLPSLRTANASPNLDSIILGVRGDAGLFRTADGARIMPFTRLRGAWFRGDNELYAATWRGDGSPAPVQRVEINSGAYADAWSPALKSNSQFTILDTHFGGPVLFVHEQSSFYVSPPRDLQYPGNKRSSKLRSLDLKSGHELWSENWEGDPPVPYADPQGERVALGWRATMSGGQALAKRYPALKKQMDAVKLTIDDAVFEVVEASSGKAVGTALVRVGWGPESFDSLFSLGDFLICVRDGARVTVYSLSTGEIHARLFGYHVSASAVAGLLAAADGNHLKLYGLKTGTKRDEYLFPDAPVYTHFAADGKRLLVLTAQQSVFILDLTAFSSSVSGSQPGPQSH